MPTPAAPARFVAYMSTTAIASTGGTFTPRGEHKSASRYLIRDAPEAFCYLWIPG